MIYSANQNRCTGMPPSTPASSRAHPSLLQSARCPPAQALEAAGVLLKEERYEHKYPYDWRTKKPTIFRATDQARVVLAGCWGLGAGCCAWGLGPEASEGG